MQGRILAILWVLCCAWSSSSRAQQAEVDSLTEVLNSTTDLQQQAKVSYELGRIYQDDMTNYEIAMDFYDRALLLATTTGWDDLRYDILQNIGYCYYSRGENLKALTSYYLIIDEIETAGPSQRLAGVYGYAGTVLEDDGRLEQAQNLYQKTLKIEQELKFKDAPPQALNAIAHYYNLKQQYDSSITSLLRAGEIFEKTKNHRWQAYNYSQLALVCIEINGFQQAISYANEGLEIALKYGLTKETYDNYAALAEVYTALEDFDEALIYYKMYANLKDSVISSELKRNIEFLEAKLDAERTQAQLDLLQEKELVQHYESTAQQRGFWFVATALIVVLMAVFVLYYRNRTNRRQKELAEASLKEKEILLQEIHHRVKNNLQLISSMLNLQSSKETDPSVITAMREAQSRVLSMALMHQKLYQKGNYSEVELQSYIQELVSSISDSYETAAIPISYDIDTEDIQFNLDTAIPLGLIINEILTNAHKHAFKDRSEGNIRIITRKRAEGKYQLTISDDGVGVPKGFNPENSSSLGMILVDSLTDQLNGELSYVVENGTTFNVTFEVVGS